MRAVGLAQALEPLYFEEEPYRVDPSPQALTLRCFEGPWRTACLTGGQVSHVAWWAEAVSPPAFLVEEAGPADSLDMVGACQGIEVVAQEAACLAVADNLLHMAGTCCTCPVAACRQPC